LGEGGATQVVGEGLIWTEKIRNLRGWN